MRRKWGGRKRQKRCRSVCYFWLALASCFRILIQAVHVTVHLSLSSLHWMNRLPLWVRKAQIQLQCSCCKLENVWGLPCVGWRNWNISTNSVHAWGKVPPCAWIVLSPTFAVLGEYIVPHRCQSAAPLPVHPAGEVPENTAEDALQSLSVEWETQKQRLAPGFAWPSPVTAASAGANQKMQVLYYCFFFLL